MPFDAFSHSPLFLSSKLMVMSLQRDFDEAEFRQRHNLQLASRQTFGVFTE
jgi:hypothetical protein